MIAFIWLYAWYAMGMAVVVNALYVGLLLTAAMNLGDASRRARYSPITELDADILPPISIVVPAFNEQVTIGYTITNLLNLDYVRYEVIVVNDGSTDETLSVLEKLFDLDLVPLQAVRKEIRTSQVRTVYRSRTYQNLIVADKFNAGKGDSLNVGINLASSPLIMTIDADTLLAPDALFQAAQVYLRDPERTVAIGGYVRVGNGCRLDNGRIVDVRVPRHGLSRCQMVEYTKAFVGGRTGWAALNGLMIVSGALGVFRRDVLVAVGGFTHHKPGEDMEIVLHIHRHMRERRIPYRVDFSADVVGWTQAPEAFRVLSAQRRRWGKGNMANMLSYRFMFFNPKYGSLGMLGVPYTILVEMLNPYLILTGFLAVLVDTIFFGMKAAGLLELFAVNTALDYLLSFGSLLMDDLAFRTFRLKDLYPIAATALHMPFWYYYLSAFWRMSGHIEFFRRRDDWGYMSRQAWSGTAPGGGVHRVN